MSGWELPEAAEVNGTAYAVRSDFRAVLDVLEILGDPELSDAERGALACEVFYPGFRDMPRGDRQAAGEFLMWFVKGGDSPARAPQRKLVDWGQDFPLIIGPVNRVLGYEARAREHVHWWTFLAAYCEVGDCLFAQVVSIRRKRQRGAKLEKHERRFYNENRGLVDFQVAETGAEKALKDEWMGVSDG